MNEKPWWQSKTIWFNGLALIGAVAGAFGFAEFHPDPQVLALAPALVALINVGLRLVTRQPIGGGACCVLRETGCGVRGVVGLGGGQ